MFNSRQRALCSHTQEHPLHLGSPTGVHLSNLIRTFAAAPVLRFSDWYKLFYIKTNASNIGLGVSLTQETKYIRFPIAYDSSTLNKSYYKY